MSKFKIGDKVVLVNAADNHNLKEYLGQEFTVLEQKDGYIAVKEHDGLLWFEWRLELAEICKTPLWEALR